MDELLQQIAAYKQEIESTPTNGADSLEAYRIKFLGTKGIVKNLFTEMRNVPADKKKEFGLILNEFKQLAESKYENWKQQLEGSGTTAAGCAAVADDGDATVVADRVGDATGIDGPCEALANDPATGHNNSGCGTAPASHRTDDPRAVEISAAATTATFPRSAAGLVCFRLGFAAPYRLHCAR